MPSVHPLWLRKLSAMPIDSPVAAAHLALDQLERTDRDFAELSDARWVAAEMGAIGVLAECAGFAAYLACPAVTRSVERTKQLVESLSEQTLAVHRQVVDAFVLPESIRVPHDEALGIDPVNLGASMLIHASGYLGAAVQERVRFKLPPLPQTWKEAGVHGDAWAMCNWIEGVHNAHYG
jgi:hypothetical protein